MSRVLIGLSVGSGLEGADAVAVRAGGLGLDLAPAVAAAVRVAFPPSVRDAVRTSSASPDHLGSVPSVLFVPAGAKVSGAVGFEAGPGNQLLDALAYHGTRGKEPTDPGGKKAVQGRCLEPLLARWLEHPHLTRTPPKAV